MTPTSSEGGGETVILLLNACTYLFFQVLLLTLTKAQLIGSEPGSKSRLAKTVIFTSISIKNITQYSHLHCPTVDHHDD